MFRLYLDVAALAGRRAAKAWFVALSPVIYGALLLFVSRVAAPLGIVGGFLFSAALAVCFASYLHLLALAVDGSKVRWDDLTRGVRTRVWDVVSVMFAVWLISFGMSMVARSAGPQADAVMAIFALATAFFLNPVPELLYQGRARSFELLLASGRFVMENPVAWFLPNVLFAAALLAPTGRLAVERPAELLLLFSAAFSTSGLQLLVASVPLWALPLMLVAFHLFMVFRGLLFRELASGGLRRRRFASR